MSFRGAPVARPGPYIGAVAGIRRCRDDERAVILAVVNAAASAYRGVSPADRWRDPYMPADELEREIRSGVVFWGCERDGELAAAKSNASISRQDARSGPLANRGHRR
jgi:hypothetical protein